MKFILIHKEPIIERIPNLKAFIIYASTHNHKIIIITTKNSTYPEPTFLNKNITYFAIKERSKKLQIPTFIRFYGFCVFKLAENIFNKYSLVIGGRHGLIFGALIGYLQVKKFCSFIIEYPEIQIKSSQKLTLADRLEIRGIKQSQFIITHDELHANFIATQIQAEKINFATLPNGTIGPSAKRQSKFLHKRLEIGKEKKILLHSGGFGAWFESSKLSEKSEVIPDIYQLVFHISHDISKDPYYIEYLANKKITDRSLFSKEPVSTTTLDELISSAYIGIAWYSTEILGYRATMIGLAAGKIGNYLKCGIPVIAPAFGSLEYLSKYSCGECISDLSELNCAITKIDSNYSFYSENALKCYEELWRTENHCKNILQKLSY